MEEDEIELDKWVDNVILTYEKKIKEICSGKNDDRRDRCLSGEAIKINIIDSDKEYNR